MPLSDVKLRSLKFEAGKPIRVFDSLGLCILLRPSGALLWQFRYKLAGKPKTLSLGAYPGVGLREARRLRDLARERLEAGEDPATKPTSEHAGETWGKYADEWLEANRGQWGETYYRRVKGRIDGDLRPHLGDKPVAALTPTDVLETIRKVEARGVAETAHRDLRYASLVMCFAVAAGAAERDVTVDVKPALKVKPPIEHRKALKASDLEAFYGRLVHEALEPMTKMAIELLILTVPRTDELRFGRKDEFEGIDGDSPIWRVPAERMKMTREHIIPLSPQAVDLFKRICALNPDSPLLFPAPTRSGVISENTMLYALYRLGYHSKATIHGFRGTFSTIANEHEWNSDWIEMQLAHVQGNVRRAYNAARYLTGRREMMKWWADFIDGKRMVADLLG